MNGRRFLCLLISSLASGALGACTAGPSSPASQGTPPSNEASASRDSENPSPDAAVCPQFEVGRPVDSSIGGSATSQVTVEAVSALASQAAKENFGVASSCQAIARALGADAVEEAQAEAQTEERARAAAWCNVALRWIGISKATAGATLTVSFEPSTCGTSVQAKAACQSRCTGAPCDANANPMSCAGGTLANGFCEGGKLEGGCATDARCDASCDVSVRAFASCAAPDVRVSYAGASDVGEAAKLATTLEHHLPSLLGLAEKCALQAEIAGTLSGNVAAVTDIAPECIARVSKTAAVAIEDVTACAQTTAAVASAFR